jgi:hypothetical protein
MRNDRHSSVVIGPLQRQTNRRGDGRRGRGKALRIADCGVRIKGKKANTRPGAAEPGGRNGCPFSRRTCPPRAVPTAGIRKSVFGNGYWGMANGRESRFGNRNSGMANGRESGIGIRDSETGNGEQAKSHGTWNLEPACRQAGLKLGTVFARQMTKDQGPMTKDK